MLNEDEDHKGGEKDDKVLYRARRQFEESQSVSSSDREEARDDIRFSRLSEQWPPNVIAQRQAEGRPCLTINKVAPQVRQIVNEARKNTPAVKVNPVDSGADVATAKVINGLIRSIQNGKHKADIAYDTALENAASGGFGFIRVGLEYVSPDSFDMELYVDSVPNPFSVHWDTSTTRFDSRDWNYAFVSEELTPDEFKTRYPKADPVDFEASYEDNTQDWIGEDTIRVAEYFERITKTRTIYQLSDGQVIRKDALPDLAKGWAGVGEMEGLDSADEDQLMAYFLEFNDLEITAQRESEYHVVIRRVISGIAILEEGEWVGSTIPICPVWGDVVTLDGRRYLRSMIRDAKDPQRMFNYWRTASTELVALAPKAPFIGPKGFVPKGHEAKWATANTQSHAYLEYDQATGPMPQRQPFASVPAGALQEAMNSADDIKATTGIFDASIGAQSNETSGKAILARERQSNTSNYHLLDNLNRAIEAVGSILVECIPAVYSARQTIRILGEDSKESVIKLTMEDGGSQEVNEDGEKELYNLSIGQYDVNVDSGTDYATAREENKEFLIEILGKVPEAAPYILDMVFRNMDFEGAEELEKRAQSMLPPQLQAAGDGQQVPQQPIPGQAPGQPGTPPQLVGQPGQ